MPPAISKPDSKPPAALPSSSSTTPGIGFSSRTGKPTTQRPPRSPGNARWNFFGATRAAKPSASARVEARLRPMVNSITKTRRANEAGVRAQCRAAALSLLLLALAVSCSGSATTATDDAVQPSQCACPRHSLGREALRGRLAYSAAGGIWSLTLPDGRRRRHTYMKGPLDDPSWSPDGRWLAYRDSRRGYNQNDEISIVSARGGSPRNLTHNPANDWGPAWAPDGQTIAFNSDRRGTPQIWLVRADGTHPRRVTTVGGEYPSWAPDSRRLVFMSSEPGASGPDPNYDIFTVDRDGRHLRQLTDWAGEDGWPAWSPDGRLIAYTTSQDDVGQRTSGTYRDVYTMHVDGSDQRRLVRGMSGEFPTWSPDGRLIVFVGAGLPAGTDRLWMVRLDGCASRSLKPRGTLPDWIGR
jgi:hypothetical protein